MGAVTLSNEWISEHATQVTRMLPGGEPQTMHLYDWALI